MSIYSRSPVQNFDNLCFWIRKNKCIAYFIKEQDDIDKIYLYPKDLSKQSMNFLLKTVKMQE